MGYDDWRRFPPSKPREAKGGIKAKSSRGAFGSSWWAKRWIATLESFDIGARLGRGRSYARQGQVLSVDIQPGTVRAGVQGSRKTPYDVEIKVTPLGQEEWGKVAEALSQQAIFVARLLAGEMPDEIEEVFQQAGLSLFPGRSSDLRTNCSCPDWSNPCKHIAAVYYLLGEEFDRDPFLIFRLRGLERSDLMAMLAGSTEAEELPDADEAALAPEPLPLQVGAFWHGRRPPDDVTGEARIPSVAAVLPRRLGAFPFWRGAAPLQDCLEPIYTNASPRGLDALVPQRRDETNNRGET